MIVPFYIKATYDIESKLKHIFNLNDFIRCRSKGALIKVTENAYYYREITPRSCYMLFNIKDINLNIFRIDNIVGIISRPLVFVIEENEFCYQNKKNLEIVKKFLELIPVKTLDGRVSDRLNYDPKKKLNRLRYVSKPSKNKSTTEREVNVLDALRLLPAKIIKDKFILVNDVQFVSETGKKFKEHSTGNLYVSTPNYENYKILEDLEKDINYSECFESYESEKILRYSKPMRLYNSGEGEYIYKTVKFNRFIVPEFIPSTGV